MKKVVIFIKQKVFENEENILLSIDHDNEK